MAYLVFVGGSWAGIYVTEIRSASIVLIAIALAGWGVAAIRAPAWLPASKLMPALLAALLAFGIGVAFSRFPRLGLEYLAAMTSVNGKRTKVSGSI